VECGGCELIDQLVLPGLILLLGDQSSIKQVLCNNNNNNNNNINNDDDDEQIFSFPHHSFSLVTLNNLQTEAKGTQSNKKNKLLDIISQQSQSQISL